MGTKYQNLKGPGASGDVFNCDANSLSSPAWLLSGACGLDLKAHFVAISISLRDGPACMLMDNDLLL